MKVKKAVSGGGPGAPAASADAGGTDSTSSRSAARIIVPTPMLNGNLVPGRLWAAQAWVSTCS